MRATSRLGASVFLSCLSLVSIILLLPSSQVSTRLQKITLGTTIDNYVPDIWKWAAGEDYTVEDGIRLVVFGDSWVDDTIAKGEEKKGKVWVQKLCEEINCTSLVNLATSQRIEAYPSAPATGAFTSNEVYLSHNESSAPRTSSYVPPASDLLPDLAAQIKKFLALPSSKPKAKETIFVVSFGIWDIYHYSGLDYTLSQSLTDSTVHELFAQLDVLYHHYRDSILSARPSDTSVTPAEQNDTSSTHPFRVIIPKLFDPTLLPGWAFQRPIPMTPSTVSEQQKNAIYLTSRWNSILENRMGSWIKNDTISQITNKKKETKEQEDDVKEETRESSSRANAQSAENQDNNEAESTKETDSVIIRKDAFYYDLPRYLTDIIIEHQLEDLGISDASGLGKKGSPFESVYYPCVVSAEDSHREEDIEFNGLLLCKEPQDYLFWDDFRLGPKANENIGEAVAEMVKQGNSVRKTWEDGKSHG